TSPGITRSPVNSGNPGLQIQRFHGRKISVADVIEPNRGAGQRTSPAHLIERARISGCILTPSTATGGLVKLKVWGFLFVLAASGWGQSFDTGILGAVTDPSGAVIPGAAITVTQPATGVVRTATTTPSGAYEIRYLLPGEWIVEVRTTGFRSQKSS